MIRELAIKYLQGIVKKKSELKYYERRVTLANLYYDYYTGELDRRLQKIISRESDEEFEQRKGLTNHITKSILNSTKLPFQKASRKLPIVRKIDFDTQTADKQKSEIEEFLTKYNGDKSLDQYLEEMMVEYNMIDPNAFLIIEFQSNTPLKKVKPYPFIAISQNVVDYNKINGEIEYVIVRQPIKFIQNQKETDGFKYTMYNGNETIVYEQVDFVEQLNRATYLIVVNEKYRETIYNVRADNDPDLKPAAIQFGYKLDAQTNYETYLSIFDCALPYLQKTLKVNSELDQSMAMMAFPQRFRYVAECQAKDCHKGWLPDGITKCPACGGTGKAQVHGGAQKVQEVDLPKDPQEMIDLAKMAYDHAPPIELLTFDDSYLRQLKVDVHTTIFNADMFTKSEVATTATEKILDVDNMNDTLHSFCRRYSQIWQVNVYYIAVFTDNVKRDINGKSNIIIQHKFPNDLKLKTLSDLMLDLKSAYDSQASMPTISAIEDDINEILYSDRPDELKKIKIQQSFHPFRGYSPADIQFFLTSGNVSKFNQTLYINYSNIWNTLERDNQKPWLYDLEPGKIWELLQTQVNDLISIIEGEKPKPVMRVNFNQPIDNNANPINLTNTQNG